MRPCANGESYAVSIRPDDCQDFLGTFSEDSQQKQALNMLEPVYRDYMFAECIATDDPRLKEK